MKERAIGIQFSLLMHAAVFAMMWALSASIVAVSRPIEIDFGILEGLEFNEIHTIFPDVEKMWIARSPSMAYPEGESLLEFENRVSKFEARLKNHRPDETVLVVAHAGTMRTIICRLLELEMKNRWNIRVDLASLSIIETYPEVNILCLLNDVSHLMSERNS